MAKQILIIEDDVQARQRLTSDLEQAGYQVHTAANGAEALTMSRQRAIDLIFLTFGSQSMDGLETLHRLRDTGVPVVLLGEGGRKIDEVMGLELGAADYIHKPFSTDVLLARVKSVLRRSERTPVPPKASSALEIGDLVIDQAAHRVTVGGKQIELPPRTFALLHALATQPSHVLSVDNLLARVWGEECYVEPQVVYVHIRWLREKLEENPTRPRRIVTVRKLGYKLVARDAEIETAVPVSTVAQAWLGAPA